MKKLIILLVLFISSCTTRYINPERAANPRRSYQIRTTKGERQMTRLIRQSTLYDKRYGCGYKK
jgi:hypothetical protein